MTRCVFALLIFLSPALACAQTMYECLSKDGPVFTDTPCPGGKRMDLGPPNVIDTQNPPQQQAASEPVASVYTAFSIVTPESGGTIHTLVLSRCS